MPQTAPIPVTLQGYKKITNITPSDTLPVPIGTKALFVETAGDVSVLMPGAASPFVFASVPAGTTLPISPLRVRATGTTSTTIAAMG